MATKNKEKLISDNSDLYISDFDKGLSYDALAGIVSAKRDYSKAEKSGDTVGMAKANASANKIRSQSGGYTGGSDGSGYYANIKFTQRERPQYNNSKYDDMIDEIYDKISSIGEFKYDVYSDPLYALYKKVYTQSADLAFERAMSAQAAKTGGIANTNAISAATQARAYYDSQLAQKATDMYNDAYDRYNDKISRLYDQLDMVKSLENDDYKQYLDELDAYETDREFDYNRYMDSENAYENSMRYAIESAYQKSRDDADDAKWQSEFDYQRERDSIKDAQWQYQSDIDRYNILAKLIQSVYNKSNIGVNVGSIMKLLGLE